MPAIYFVSTSMNGQETWLVRNDAGLSEGGPSDKRLVIQFSGVTPPLWVKKASYGYVIDVEELAKHEPGLFRWKWLNEFRFARVKATKTERGFNFDAKL